MIADSTTLLLLALAALAGFFLYLRKYALPPTPRRMHPSTLRKAHQKQVFYLVIWLVLASLFIGFGIAELYSKSSGSRDAADVLLSIGLLWAVSVISWFLHGRHQLRRIVLDPLCPKPMDLWTDVKPQLLDLARCVAAAVGLIVGLFILGLVGPPLYDAFGPQRQMPDAQRQSKEIALALTNVESTFLGYLPLGSQLRLEPKTGGVLEIYLSKSEFESIPFPDRKDAIERVGRVWCNDQSNTNELLPTLNIFDIRTGERFGKYSCRLSSVSLP